MLEVNNLSVSFVAHDGVTQAVKNVSFAVDKGQTLGIVGESGSGKSVTCYSLLGLIPTPPGRIDSGVARFLDRDLLAMPETELRQVRGNRISMIFQDPMTSLNPYMTVGKQISEALLLHHDLNKKQAIARSIAALEEVGILNAEHRLNSYPHEFSGGMRQRVMIAMALATEPDLLIADEPTTALDVTIQAQILDLLEYIKQKRQLTMIFISHDLSVVHNIADEILVMCRGKVVEQGEPQQLFKNPQHPYTQKLIAAIPTSEKTSNPTLAESKFISVYKLKTTFEFSNGPIWAKRVQQVKAVNDVSFDIYEGEILGLVGESGSGKSTLGRTITRLVDADSGQVLFDGMDLLELHGSNLKQARQHFQMVFQDPYASLNPRMTVFDTLAEPIKLRERISPPELDKRINNLLDEVGMPRSSIRKYPHEFSGGQRQRIAIARALASKPKFIVADEPVSALDVTIQAQVLELLLELVRKHGLTMLFISHDLGVVRYLCDRVAVMRAGAIVELGATSEIFDAPKDSYTQKLIDAIPRTVESRANAIS